MKHLLFVILFCLGWTIHSWGQTICDPEGSVIPFVDIYSADGVFLGTTDMEGGYGEMLLKNIAGHGESTGFVLKNSFYVTQSVSKNDFTSAGHIVLTPIAYSMEEIVVRPNADYKYEIVEVFFRTTQMNENRVHYHVEGIAQYCINRKNNKATVNISSIKSHVNSSIRQLKETGLSTVIVTTPCVIPYNDFMDYNSLSKQYDFRRTDNRINMLSHKTGIVSGQVSSDNGMTITDRIVIRESKPDTMKMFGLEVIRDRNVYTWVHDTDSVEKTGFSNLLYAKNNYGCFAKMQRDSNYQRIESVQEIFVLSRSYSNDKIGNNNIPRVHAVRSINADQVPEEVNHIFFQPVGDFIMKSLEELNE